MEPIAIGVALGGAALVVAVAFRRRALRRHVPKDDVVGECRIRFDRDLSGFSVEPPRPFPPGLAVHQTVNRWRSGDQAFDRAIAIEGEARWLAARMNAEVRGAFCELASLGLVIIADGMLRLRLLWIRPERARLAIDAAVRVARLLAEEIEVPSATAENAKSDPIPAVRLRCLEILIRDHAPGTKGLALEMLADPDVEVRLLAAQHAGPKGVEVLWEIASRRGAPERLRAIALAEYVKHETSEEARARLEQLCVEAQPGLVSAAIARAVAQIGGPFEAPMIAMLEAGEMLAQAEAAKALARIGTIAAVEPLLAFAKRSSAPDDVRALARRTVAKIQGSARGEAGRLSVVQAEGEGRLSVAGGGELSLDDDAS